jgi:hypothetical protein
MCTYAHILTPAPLRGRGERLRKILICIGSPSGTPMRVDTSGSRKWLIDSGVFQDGRDHQLMYGFSHVGINV